MSQTRQRQQRPRRERKPREEEVWIPKTNLGKKVASGEITAMEEILENNEKENLIFPDFSER
jgi:small subunit ribosomal protein S5